MRAVQVITTSGPSGIQIQDVVEPVPGPDDVLVEVHRVGISFPDLLLSKGEYQLKPEPPFTLGVDFAGTVISGPGFEPGQRVAGVGPYGGAADRVANPAMFTFALPDSLSFDEGAALPMNYLTAQFALAERGDLQADETVLVHGAAPGRGAACGHGGRAPAQGEVVQDSQRSLSLHPPAGCHPARLPRPPRRHAHPRAGQGTQGPHVRDGVGFEPQA